MEDIEFLVAKDLRAAAQKLSTSEARYVVDLYYQVQEFRKASGNQIRSLTENEPGELIKSIFGSFEKVENRIKKAMDYYTDTQPMGQWAKSVIGVGPVIAGGLIANIDLAKCKTVGSIWRFAGLDPSSKWNKGEKRPWNASLKRLCWLIGESFVKVSGNPDALYGRLYLQRKAYEQARNEAGELKDQALAKLKQFKIDKSTDAYKYYSGTWDLNELKVREQVHEFIKSYSLINPDVTEKEAYDLLVEQGHIQLKPKLPPAHIHERAKRWAVKVFLCHYFEEGCRRVLGKEPPLIYSIAMLGHIHKIEAGK